jgi:hypothetical protein
MQHADYVAHSSPGRRGHDPDGSRESRQGSLALPVKESLRSETLPELFKGQLERTEAFGLHMLKNNLVLSARFIDRDPSPHDDVEPVLQAKARSTGGRSKKDRPNLSGIVLERTIEVSGSGGAQIGDFPFQPHLGEIGFK